MNLQSQNRRGYRRSFSRPKYALAYGQRHRSQHHDPVIETGYTGAHWWNVQTGERRRRVVHPHKWRDDKAASPFLIQRRPHHENCQNQRTHKACEPFEPYRR